VYDLYAVSNHYGGYGGGHYTAYCCDGQGAWHCFDDSHVSPIDAARVQSPAAYVLFYRRRAEAAADPGVSLALSTTSSYLCCTVERMALQCVMAHAIPVPNHPIISLMTQAVQR
jgi:hypothetical protein